jgi:hypothetical protein
MKQPGLPPISCDAVSSPEQDEPVTPRSEKTRAAQLARSVANTARIEQELAANAARLESIRKEFASGKEAIAATAARHVALVSALAEEDATASSVERDTVARLKEEYAATVAHTAAHVANIEASFADIEEMKDVAASVE